jgi:hypothetical protein
MDRAEGDEAGTLETAGQQYLAEQHQQVVEAYTDEHEETIEERKHRLTAAIRDLFSAAQQEIDHMPRGIDVAHQQEQLSVIYGVRYSPQGLQAILPQMRAQTADDKREELEYLFGRERDGLGNTLLAPYRQNEAILTALEEQAGDEEMEDPDLTEALLDTHEGESDYDSYIDELHASKVRELELVAKGVLEEIGVPKDDVEEEMQQYRKVAGDVARTITDIEERRKEQLYGDDQ